MCSYLIFIHLLVVVSASHLSSIVWFIVRTCSEWEMSSPVGFMAYVVEPLFVEWSRFSDTLLSQTMMSHLSLNKQGWNEGRDKQEASSSRASEEQRTPATKDSNSKVLPQGSKGSWHAKHDWRPRWGEKEWNESPHPTETTLPSTPSTTATQPHAPHLG